MRRKSVVAKTRLTIYAKDSVFKQLRAIEDVTNMDRPAIVVLAISKLYHQFVNSRKRQRPDVEGTT